MEYVYLGPAYRTKIMDLFAKYLSWTNTGVEPAGIISAWGTIDSTLVEFLTEVNNISQDFCTLSSCAHDASKPIHRSSTPFVMIYFTKEAHDLFLANCVPSLLSWGNHGDFSISQIFNPESTRKSIQNVVKIIWKEEKATESLAFLKQVLTESFGKKE